MSSTDSDESIQFNSKRHKSSKKSKKKLEKKHKRHRKEKRHKQRKRTKRDSSSSSSSDSTSEKQHKSLTVFRVKPGFVTPSGVEIECADVDAFGPALPPHFRQSNAANPVIIGPQIPSNLNAVFASTVEVGSAMDKQTTAVSANEPDEEELADTYGPIPLLTDSNNQKHPLSAAQIELEQRALELKLAAINGTNCKPVEQKVREEWMLELPDVGLKGGLASLSNMKRKFHHGKEKPDFSDRSEWTKTPQAEGSGTKKTANTKTTAETMLSDALEIFERQRDEEQESIARKHKKNHKRDESLVEMHQKKLRKEQRQKEKELAAAGAKPERRPFSRDVDLKLNKIDKNQTKSIVDKAKVLNTKFSTGHTKYL